MTKVDGHAPVEEKPKPVNLLKAKVCWKCGHKNSFDLQYCTKCNSIIDDVLSLKKQAEEAERERLRQGDLNETMRHADMLIAEKVKELFANALKSAPVDIHTCKKAEEEEGNIWD